MAFASHELGAGNLPNGYVKADEGKPVGIEIALITDDVQAAFNRAVNAGAELIKAPMTKPWGQVVAYVRCPAG